MTLWRRMNVMLFVVKLPANSSKGRCEFPYFGMFPFSSAGVIAVSLTPLRSTVGAEYTNS
eukprot:m.293729 g.293729  ORF g.293729 m.293729 type:complete len:60 (+) comp16248_c0_seq13:255-434(+)